MSEIPTKPSKMTPEEKKEKAKEYNRNYMANRRLNDPEFLQKQREKCREVNRKRYNDKKDTSFREKKTEYNAMYYQKLKDVYKEARKSLKKTA